MAEPIVRDQRRQQLNRPTQSIGVPNKPPEFIGWNICGPQPLQTWRTFLRNHIGQIVAADFFVVRDVSTAVRPRLPRA